MYKLRHFRVKMNYILTHKSQIDICLLLAEFQTNFKHAVTISIFMFFLPSTFAYVSALLSYRPLLPFISIAVQPYPTS